MVMVCGLVRGLSAVGKPGEDPVEEAVEGMVHVDQLLEDCECSKHCAWYIADRGFNDVGWCSLRFLDKGGPEARDQHDDE